MMLINFRTVAVLCLNSATKNSCHTLTLRRPTRQATVNLLHESEKQFMRADESALSIVPSRLSSRLSSSTDQASSHDGTRSYETMVYRRLSFEDALFTAKVYKRNYRNRRVQLPRKQEPDHDNETITPGKELRQSRSLRADLVALRFTKVLTTVRGLSKGIDSNADTMRSSAATVFKDTTVPSEERNQGLEYRGSSSATGSYEDLIKACCRGNNDRVKRLLKMWQTSNAGGSEIPSVLLSSSCDSLHLCPIHATVFNGHVEVMETLFQQSDPEHDIGRVLGTAMYCTRGSRWPPLHVAAMKGNLSMVTLLLEKGAVVDKEAEYGVQALHEASKTGSIAVIGALIDAGADVNCADREGRRPLHYISESQDRPDVILYLAERGASIVEPDHSNGLTSLFLARQNDFTGNIKALLSLGALTDEPPPPLGDMTLD